MQYPNKASTFDGHPDPKVFTDWVRGIIEQIKNISSELYNDSEEPPFSIVVDQKKNSIREIEKLLNELRYLQQDKTNRLNHVKLQISG